MSYEFKVFYNTGWRQTVSGKDLWTLAPNQDPYQLGRVILSLIYLFIFGMVFTANWSHIRSGRILSTIVAKLSNQPNPQSQLTPGGIIVLIWLLMWALSSILAKLYIHFSLKRRPQSMAIQVGLAISYKRLFRGRRNKWSNWFVSAEFRLFLGTENSRNSIPNHFAEEKNAQNSVPWNKNRSELLEFRLNRSSKEKNTRNSVPWKANSWNFVPKHVSDKKKCCPLCLMEQDF